ncbi:MULTISPECIES: hypothetical protein [Alcaligenes]|uniref:Uncharacterized protein n=2 Tax=Alcaligenes TaxID=507 RepID=A0A3G2HY50_9BURK|nr:MULTISPECIES: hypothetical protein [Alcaligenes]AYN21997.1 hypothetical protein D3M96_16540 [Alcaligenes aquatilis]MCX5566504.1 hypothetical protein [Alcaligenes phenolicus]
MLLMKIARFMSYYEFMALTVPFVVLLVYLITSKEGLQWNEASGKMVPYKTTGFMAVLKETDVMDWFLSIVIVLVLGSGSWFYMKTTYLTSGDIARFSNQGEECELRELAQMKPYARNKPFTVFDYETAKDRCKFKSSDLNNKEIMEFQREILTRMGHQVELAPKSPRDESDDSNSQ